jgi:hypothetical protein
MDSSRSLANPPESVCCPFRFSVQIANRFCKSPVVFSTRHSLGFTRCSPVFATRVDSPPANGSDGLRWAPFNYPTNAQDALQWGWAWPERSPLYFLHFSPPIDKQAKANQTKKFHFVPSGGEKRARALFPDGISFSVFFPRIHGFQGFSGRFS